MKVLHAIKFISIVPYIICLSYSQSYGQGTTFNAPSTIEGDRPDSFFISKVDSILSLDQVSGSDFKLLNESLFNINYYQSYLARHLYKRAIKKLTAEDKTIEAGILMRWLADLYYELAYTDSAQFYIDQAASIFEQRNDRSEYARTANLRRLLLTADTDFSDALKVCFEALNIFTDTEDEIGKAITFRDIGSIKLQQKKYEEALDYCLKSQGLLEKYNYWYELTFTYQRIALVYIKLQNRSLALAYSNRAIHACKQLNWFRSFQGLLKKHWTKGSVYEAFRDFDEALVQYDSSKYYAQLVHYKYLDKWLLNNKGEIYLEQGKYELALSYFQQALAFIEKQQIHQNAYDYFNPIYENIIKVNQALGHYQEANEYLLKLSASKDSIFRLESEKQIAELETKYQTLQKENQISQLQKDKANQRTILMLIAIFLLAMIGLVYFLWRNNIFRAKMNKVLKEQKEEITLKNTENELLLKEIHHRVKNNLEIISGLLALQSAQISDINIQKAMQASQNRVQAMGLLHQKLYQGTSLGSIEMKDYFIHLTQHLMDSFESEKRVKIELAMKKLELDIDTAVPIGLIVNELLTNALKYAFPENSKGLINISLQETSPEMLVLTVKDNGIGIDADKQSAGTGFGSQLIHLLTRQLRGTLHQESKDGTTITIKLKKSKAA
ncbi:MAG: tetratricopeptide repeat protein [Saprospiraceae bacterium]|nr:tetratricopeptide repeat protein [Saprospiraceae bacterium]